MTPEMNRERAINLLNEFGLPLDEERITMIGDFLAIWIGWELTGVQQPAPALEPNWENVGYEIKHKIAAHKANHGGDQPSNLDMGAIAERAIRVSSCVQQPATEPDEPADSMQGDVDDERSALLVKAIKSAPKNATWMAYLIHGFDAALALRDVLQGQQIDWADAERRLAKFIAVKESRHRKTLDEALYHQSKWERILPEAVEMLNEVFPVAARQVSVGPEGKK